MADYKELLRRAVEALPENNGAARRAVYEKARAALVGQLRAINPPLAARDITAHRLQLEDCIRQVEQEASEAVIAGLGGGMREDDPPPPPVYFEPPAKKSLPGVAKPVAKAPPAPVKEPPKPLPAGDSIEEIIAAANAEHEDSQPDQTRSVARPDTKPMGRPVPKLVGQPRSNAAAEARAKQEEARREEARREEARQEEARREEARWAEEARQEEERREEIRREEIRLEEERLEEQRREEQRREEQRRLAARREEFRRETPANDVDGPPAGVDRVVPAPSRGAAKAPVGRPLPSIVARAEAAKSRSNPAAFGAPIDGARRGPVLEPRREAPTPRFETAARGGAQAARQVSAQVASYDDEPIAAAMSSVREVELEADPQSLDPQGAIDRAIATLDREARDVEDGAALASDLAPPDEEIGGKSRKQRRGKAEAAPLGRIGRDGNAAPAAAFARQAKDRDAKLKGARRGKMQDDDTAFARSRQDGRRGLGAVTIFLLVFAVLIIGAGGAGFWAWREGYVNLDALFGRGGAATQEAAVATPVAAVATDVPAKGPGNTSPSTAVVEPAAELKPGERLPEDTSAVAATPLPLTDPGKDEERLGAASDSAAGAAGTLAALDDPAKIAGSQSLLLEAQDNGTTGAVPFSGTVEWTKGTDEMGLPTLIGKANIPARNLGVDVLIRKNSDRALPASHVMEISFKVNDSFIGGAIARLPGVLLKNEELVQGTPLIGASARIVGNQFLFALNASPEDVAANTQLLTSRKWIDLALMYATGKRAIITLEKDEAAQALFTEVVDAWNKAAASGNQG